MPTYDYVCSQCDHEWEYFQRMKAKPIRKCPRCGKLSAKRLIGAGAGIIFKGSGFYLTDYRSKSYKDGAASEKSKQTSSTAKKDSTKSSSESKSTTKATAD